MKRLTVCLPPPSSEGLVEAVALDRRVTVIVITLHRAMVGKATSYSLATLGTRGAIGCAGGRTQMFPPALARSSALLYMRCTVHVRPPTVIVPWMPLHRSPFSSPDEPSNHALPIGFEIISANSCDATCVCRCSCVSDVCSEQPA